MKKTILFIVLVFYIFSFSACKDDDWATYKNVNYELCTKIEGNIFLISEIESELLSVISMYDNDVKLTYAQYIFEDENNGVVEFQFFREYKKGSTYYSVVITLYANLSNGIIYKVNYEEGHGKRVRGYSNNILKKDENAFDIYQSSLNNSIINYNTVEYTKIQYQNNEVSVYLYSYEGELLYKG